MKKNFIITLFIAGLVIISASCGSSKKISTSTEKPKKIEGTFTMSVDESQIIKLNANPTTGFVWVLTTSIDRTVLEMSKEYKASNDSGSMIGSGGTETFTFKALKKGKTYVTLEYKKKGEEPTKIKSYEFNIK